MPKSKLNAEPQVEKEKDFLPDAPEVSCFLSCQAAVNQLRGLSSAFEGGEISANPFLARFKAVLEQLGPMVAATERFDIVMPVLGEGQFSPYFWRWFNWWEDYFRQLTPGEIEKIADLASERLLAVNAFRPNQDWSTCRATPAFTLPGSLGQASC